MFPRLPIDDVFDSFNRHHHGCECRRCRPTFHDDAEQFRTWRLENSNQNRIILLEKQIQVLITELAEMKKEVMGKIKRATGSRESTGGTTKARTMMAEKMDKAMEKKGERNEMKKSDKVNRTTASKR